MRDTDLRLEYRRDLALRPPLPGEEQFEERAGAGRVGRLQAGEQRGIEERGDARELGGNQRLAEDAPEVRRDLSCPRP
jgi:hypothetical protein